MLNNKPIVTIPVPCHENWNAMKPKETGKFCAVCEKTVIDFTQKTNAEIRQLYTEREGNLCGRFNATQVKHNTTAVVPKPLKPSFFRTRWLAFVTSLSMVGLGRKAHAQLQGKPVMYGGQKEEKNGINTKTVIHGWIKNSATQKGVSEVEIRVYSGGKEIAYSTSFLNGSYFITVPEHTVYDFKVTIAYNSAEFVAKFLEELPINKERIKCDIEMIPLTYQQVENVVGAFEIPPQIEYVTMGVPVMVHEPVETDSVYRIHAITTENKPENREEPFVDSTYQKKEAPLVDMDVKVYPNPTNGIFNVQFNEQAKQLICIYNMAGEAIETRTTTHAHETFNIGNKPNGMYTVKVVNLQTNRTKTVRIIKTN